MLDPVSIAGTIHFGWSHAGTRVLGARHPYSSFLPGDGSGSGPWAAWGAGDSAEADVTVVMILLKDLVLIHLHW